MPTLLESDRATIWHPFGQEKTAPTPIPIVRGKGAYLFGENGECYLDAISSWWVNLHGHCHPYIVEAVKRQVEQLEHVVFAGFTHPPAVALAERLLALTKMAKIFYSDNGSTSVEIALKMALQNNKKQEVVCLKGSYFGDTFGAMSAAGKTEFNSPFWKKMFGVSAIETPEELREIVARGETACFIFEPLIMGTGGMKIYPKERLSEFLRICKEYEVVAIADECMTGFGRTGTIFAIDQIEERPDIICMAKGLTGGFLPLAATACTQEIYDRFYSDDWRKALLHGHSYTANPIACACALASLDLLEKSGEAREMIAKSHRRFVEKMRGHPGLIRCESLGTILVLEYCTEQTYFSQIRDQLYRFFLENGVLLRPLGNVLYVMPPYCVTEDELERIYKLIRVTL